MQSLSTCRRSTLPGPLPPVEVVRRILELVRKARFWPSRASSREIDSTSPDATADGRDRRRAHETHLERRGSLQSEEMTTNRARARTSSALIGSAMVRVPPNGSKSAHILHFESLLGCVEAATLTTSPMGMIRRSILRRLVLLGPRRAPKCRFGWTLKEPKTATFGTIILDLNLFDRSFLRQLPSQLQYGAGGTLSHSILCQSCTTEATTGWMSILGQD